MRNDGLKLLCLLLLLTGCSATPKRCEPIVRTETVEVDVPVFVALPEALTAPVAEPDAPSGGVMTNEDLVDWLEALRAALREANSKLAAVRSKQPESPK
jgi:hypothetical protein